jgi:peptide/nickel transport system permease protein
MIGLSSLFANRRALLGLTLLALFAALAVVGPWVVGDPSEFVAVPLQPPSGAHWFGTTGQGQDVFAQTLAGARGTLTLGFAVGAVVLALGALVGMVAGYFGGWIDEALSLLVNLFLLIPGLPLAVVIAAYLPAGPGTLALVLILTGWAWTARVIRAATLSLRQADFVSAALVAGETHLRIVTCEILPNMLPLLASAFIGAVTYAIAAEVGLEFLGLGDLDRVTWGTNLYWASNDVALPSGSWWTFVPTGVAVALVGFALALVNAGLDQLGNPQLDPQRAFLRAVGRKHAPLNAATPVLRRSHG